MAMSVAKGKTRSCAFDVEVMIFILDMIVGLARLRQRTDILTSETGFLSSTVSRRVPACRLQWCIASRQFH
jgi:hypothetical protein